MEVVLDELCFGRTVGHRSSGDSLVTVLDKGAQLPEVRRQRAGHRQDLTQLLLLLLHGRQPGPTRLDVVPLLLEPGDLPIDPTNLHAPVGVGHIRERVDGMRDAL